VNDCAAFLDRVSKSRVDTKLTIAEWLLPELLIDERLAGPAGPEPTPGANDLSVVAGRAKWGLERILGVALPDVRADSSPTELKELQREASRLLEAYRNGVIARAGEHRISPTALAELRQKYRGKITPRVGTEDDAEAMAAMDKLLSEWSPIGRKMDDLVSIVGLRGDTDADYTNGTVVYNFRYAATVMLYRFDVRDGIIRAVRIRSHD
jgi:hypothetical protein